jgi:hypothetical protein
MKVARLSAPLTGRLYPQGRSLVLISATEWVDPGDIKRPEGWSPFFKKLRLKCYATSCPEKLNFRGTRDRQMAQGIEWSNYGQLVITRETGVQKTWKDMWIPQEVVDSTDGQKLSRNLGWNSPNSQAKLHKFLHFSLSTVAIMASLLVCVCTVHKQPVFRNSTDVQRPVLRRRRCNRRNTFGSARRRSE